MEIKIQAKDFQTAIDIAFRDYGITVTDILDFDEDVKGEFTFKVSKTLDTEIELNNQVDSLIKSNNFSSIDVAFICSDSKVHTPSGGNLFEKIKSLLKDGFIPIVGYANFIEAANDWSSIESLVETQPVVFDDLILSKEGNLLKGTKFCKHRRVNSRLSDPVFDLEVDCLNPKDLDDLFSNVLTKVGLGEYADSYVEGNKFLFTPTPQVPMEVLNLLLLSINDMPGIKRVTIKNEICTLKGDMK